MVAAWALSFLSAVLGLGAGALAFPRKRTASSLMDSLSLSLLLQVLLESVLVILHALVAQRGGRRLLPDGGLLHTGLRRSGSSLSCGETSRSLLGRWAAFVKLRDVVRLRPLEFQLFRSHLRLLLGSRLSERFLLIGCNRAQEVRLLNVMHHCPP